MVKTNKQDYDYILNIDDEKIGVYINDIRVTKNNGLHYICLFFSENGDNLGAFAGYSKPDEWTPICPNEIEKIYRKCTLNK